MASSRQAGIVPEPGRPGPRDQDAFQRVVLAAGKVIYENDATHQAVMQMLQSGGEPDAALANTAATVIRQLYDKSGRTMPETVVLPAAMQVIAMLAELAQAAGLFRVDKGVMMRAAQRCIAALMQDFGVTPDDMQAFARRAGARMSGNGMRGGVSPSQRDAAPPGGIMAAQREGTAA